MASPSLVRHDSNSTQYSWWWVSNISPKNSKWLQDNVTDMDVMVQAMIKLINEDADSFARRAEMYYKKRPELMKLVEEFYRAYRALAERYDQATGALRQAHRTISEAFPNQMPPMSEESPSSGQDMEPRTPEMQTSIRAPFDLDDLHKDAVGVSPHLFTVKRNGTQPDEIGLSSSRKGLKQFNDLFASSDSAHRVNFTDGKVRKGLSFESPDIKGNKDVSNDIMNLHHEITKLSMESQSLKQQVSSESQRANKAESEIHSLKDTISCLISEKDTTLLQYSESTRRLSVLEPELSKAHIELKRLSDHMAMEVDKLKCAESHNRAMQSELQTLDQKIRVQEQELEQSRKEIESFHFSLQDERAKRKQAEDALCSIEKQYTQSQKEVNRLALEMDTANDRLSDFMQVKLNLENAVRELKKEVSSLEVKMRILVQELEQKREDVDDIHARLQDEHSNHMQKEAALRVMENLHSQSQEEAKKIAQDLEHSKKKLSDLENNNVKLHDLSQGLKKTVSELSSQKDSALLQQQKSLEKVSFLEAQILVMRSEMEKIVQRAQMLDQELENKNKEASKLQGNLQKEVQKCILAETSLLSLEHLYTKSQEEAKTLSHDLERLSNKLTQVENDKLDLLNISQELKNIISEINAEKESVLLQQQQSIERVSCLEAQLLDVQSELEKNKQKVQLLEQNLTHKNEELNGLQTNLEEEGLKRMCAETALSMVENLHSKSQEEVGKLVMDLDKLENELSEMQGRNLIIEELSSELRNTISLLNSEKDAALLQQQLSLERASDLKSQLSKMQLELEKTEQKVQMMEQELADKSGMVDFLQLSLQGEGKKRVQAEAALTSSGNLYSQSQEDVNRLALEIERLSGKFNETENMSSEYKNTILLLNSEKEMSLIQYKQSLLRISDLESKLSVVQAELENAEHKAQMLDKELKHKREEADSMRTSLQDEAQKRIKGEAALLTMTNLHSQSQKEVNRLTPEIERLNRKLNEVQQVSSELKNTILLLNSDKDVAILQHKQSLVRLSDLESELSDVQAELANAEQNMQILDKELKQKTKEVDSLQASLKDEAQKRVECEVALLATEDLHSQSQEEMSRLILEIEMLHGKLNEVENSTLDLQNMISKHSEDIHILSEKNLFTELTIRGLHDQLEMLKEMNVGLENEMGIHIGEKEVLQQDLGRQKEDKDILEKRLCSLEHEMKAANRRAETLQHLIEDLQNKNVELEEVCKVHDVEKTLLLEKIRGMEELSEEHSILKKSFSNAIVEMEDLKEIVKELEVSESSLKYDISLHTTEKDVLALELEALDKKYTDILEKKSILETSFANVNYELQELRVKYKDSEESSRSYHIDNTALLAEKHKLLSQLEITAVALKSLEDKHADLGDFHASLLAEKDLLSCQVNNMQDQLELKNEQHEALLKFHQMQVNEYEEMICSLQEKICRMDQMLEQEQQKCTDASISTLILKNSLSDAKDKNLALFNECQKFICSAYSAEGLIAQLKEEARKEEVEKEALLNHNEKLRNGISDQIKVLNVCKDLGPTDVVDDEIMLQTVSREIFNHVKYKEETEDRNVFMDAELSILGTILAQTVIDFRDLHLQKCELEKGVETGAAELLFLRKKNHKLIETNEQLEQRLQQGGNREEMLKIEILGLCEELSGLRKSYQSSQNEICNLTEKYKSLLQEYEVLVDKYNALDDENSAVLAECIMLDLLSSLFRDHGDESASVLVSLNNDMAALGTIRHELEREVTMLNRRNKILEMDCKHFKCTLENIVEVLGNHLVLSEFDSNMSNIICQELEIERKSSMTQLMQKDDRLHKIDEKVQFLQETNHELCRVIRDLEVAVEDAEEVKGDLEKKITTLTQQGAIQDNEIRLLCEANNTLQVEVGIHKQKEQSLTSTLGTVRREAEQHEREIIMLLCDTITCSVNTIVYEELVLELMMEHEALEIRMFTERDMLMKEISSRDAYVDDLHKRIARMRGENSELKAELTTYLPLVASLSDQIRVLEDSTLLLSKLYEEGRLEFVQEDRHCPESQEDSSGSLKLQSLIARVEALQVVILDVKGHRDKEFTESAAKLEAANIQIQELKTRKCLNTKEQYIEDDRQKYDADNSKGKHIQIMKDIELDQVSTCSLYGTGATIYPLGGDANVELDDEMLQLWETAEKDCKNQTAKSSSSEHDIQAVEEVKSEYPSFELARGRDVGIDRLENSTVSLEPQQLWSKNVLEKLASDAQRLSIVQASIEEIKQKMVGASKGKSTTSSEYSSIRAQLQEIDGFVLEQIDFNSNLTKKAENYPAFEVSAELEGYSSRRKISEQVQKGSEKVAKLELELQKIQYVLLKLEEEHEYKRVKVSEKRSRVLLRDYMYARKDKNDAGQKKKKRIPFCGCVLIKTRTET
ncbi:hypothetical protein ABZP36_005183 [Zizania latifolia]